MRGSPCRVRVIDCSSFSSSSVRVKPRCWEVLARDMLDMGRGGINAVEPARCAIEGGAESRLVCVCTLLGKHLCKPLWTSVHAKTSAKLGLDLVSCSHPPLLSSSTYLPMLNPYLTVLRTRTASLADN